MIGITEDVKLNAAAQAALLNVRNNIRYIKAATSWNYWLSWYKQQAQNLCLYCFGEEDRFDQCSGIALRQERLEAYNYLFTQVIPFQPYERTISISGQYTFYIDDEKVGITIPDEIATYPIDEQSKPPLLLDAKTENAVVKVDLRKLNNCAKEITVKESELGLPSENFEERLQALTFVVENNDQIIETQSVQINGLFHLAGALGIGKSTIIKLLIYYLATVENRHVSIIMNTVVEAFEMARWLHLMEIRATPALGRNRVEHAKRVGFANPSVFSPDTILLHPNEEEPLYQWMPKPCALSPLAEKDIPTGQEPCFSLMDDDGKRHHCPLLPVCPIHQITRDLTDSQVWVLNPASFLYSRAPEVKNQQNLRLAEAVYHHSDLLIIDEADRVQANWDNAFAPSSVILGTYDAFVDWLHQRLTSMTVGESRNTVARIAITRLTKIDDHCNTLANRVYELLNRGRNQRLAQWVENRQLTNETMFARLLRELKPKFPKHMSDAERERRLEQLRNVFKNYWKNPLRRQNGFLAEWLNDFLGSDVRRKQHDKELDNWLIEQMDWMDVKPKNYKTMCRRLDMAVTLVALIKRIDDITHQMRWVQDELGLSAPSNNAPLPDVLLDAMPEPPLGRILGLRIVTSQKNNHRTFHTVRYRGVGRWLMHNFHRLFVDRTGAVGPHVLLTSATSWMPQSSIFHIAQQPHAILSKRQDALKQAIVDIRFSPVENDSNRLRISGSKEKEHNIKRMVQSIATGSPSDIEKELNHWQSKGENRCVLLVVNSYEQANWVMEELQTIAKLHGRVIRLFPDDAELIRFGIRTREVETFHKKNADILIAPLMAIQRGFNILDGLGNAILGSAFFMVRPYPPPYDLNPQIMSLNAWYMEQLHNHGRTLIDTYPDTLEGIEELRRKAHREWRRRLSNKGSLASLDDTLYQEYLRDSFITIWQTIGRMTRGGSSARVFFIDEAFGASKGKRHMLNDWHDMLASLFETDDIFEKQLAQELYQTAWQAFARAKQQRRL